MGNKLSTEEINERLKPKSLKLVGKYRGLVNRADIKCLKCGHMWSPLMCSVVTNGTGCPKCYDKYKLTEEIIDIKLSKRKIELIGNYSSRHGCTFKCLQCNCKWSTSGYSVIIKETGCPKCSGVCPLDPHDVLQTLRVRRIKLLGKYTISTQKYKFQCLSCQTIWKRDFRMIWYQNGKCPSCFPPNKARFLSKVVVDSHLRKLDICLFEEYIGVEKEYKFGCLKCNHVWKTKFKNVYYNKKGCPICRPPEWKSQEDVRSLIQKITNRKFIPANNIKWLRGMNGGQLKLDGYCPKLKNRRYPGGVAFEYQGEQHYELCHFNDYNQKELRIQKLNDLRKRVQCLRYGVLLICVSFKMRAQEEWKKVIGAVIRSKLKHGGFTTPSKPQMI